MQRTQINSSSKAFMKLLLSGLGYMVMGNLLAAIMSFSLWIFGGEILIIGMAVLFAITIYLLLVAVPAYRDGLAEGFKRKNKSLEYGDIPKWRWAAIGAVLWAVMLIPSVIFLIVEFNAGVYAWICGAVNPLLSYFVFSPYISMGFYALTIPACHIGFMLGLGDKFNKDTIMYENSENK